MAEIDEKTDTYSVKLPLFEGPLDLLLHLIRENKVDIYDIPIAEITRQYLEYLELMRELNLEVAGEFLVMAATLIQIKTRMLLPVDEDVPPEEREDPRIELVEKLLEYQAFKEASLQLRDRAETWKDFLGRSPSPLNGTDEPEEPLLFDLNLYDLLGAFKRLLERAPAKAVEITKEVLTVKERMNFLMDSLKGKSAVRFEDVFAPDDDRAVLIVTFLAILELLRLGVLRCYQEREFGQIWLIAREKVEENTLSQVDNENEDDDNTLEIL
ncbi:MAG: segregation/condensation protein A [Nitrospirae bacterium]|nr:MAG: segregation/condensation protein A [Nitrospirota bacterium]